MRNNKQHNKKILLVMGFVLALTISCSAILSSCSTGDNKQVVKIAVVGPESRMTGEFKNGVGLAVNEINNNGYLKDKEVKVKYFDDKRDLSTGIEVAQRIADNADSYSAVIGHWNAFINIPAAAIYETAGLTAITPMVSSPDLTRDNSKYIFRLVPTDKDEAKKMAEYAKNKGYDNIAVCYTDSDYGRGLAREFNSACAERGINITDNHSDFVDQNDFDRQYAKWEALDTKAVFIADSLPYAKDLIEKIRAKNKELPILSAGGFSFDDVIGLVGDDSAGIAYTALYNPSAQKKSQKKFNSKYSKKYGDAPKSFLAEKGYESIYIVAAAIRKSGKTDSESVAEQLHKMTNWQCVSNRYTFKRNGDPKGLKLYIVEVDGKTYHYN